MDKDLDLRLEIDQSLLEDPRFNLISWLRYVTSDGNFHKEYMLQYKYFYKPIPIGEEDLYFNWLRLANFIKDEKTLC